MRIDNKPYRRNIFGKLVPAMEADDLTAATDDMMKRAGTKQADQGNLNPEAPTEGADMSGDSAAGAPADNADGSGDDILGGEDGGEGGDMGSDTGMGGDTAGGGDMGEGGDQGSGDDENLANQSPESINSVTKLHSNMTNFYHAVVSASKTLGNFGVPASSSELRDIYNSAINHLNEMKDLIFEELKTDFTVENYGVKLRKYVALRHVYSAVLEMVSLHFDVLDKEMDRNKTGKP